MGVYLCIPESKNAEEGRKTHTKQMGKKNDKKGGPPPNVPEHIVRKRIREAETVASNESTALALTLMLSVLLDKFGMEESIQSVYNAWNERAEAVKNGEVKLHEWRNVLRKEYFIDI